MSARSRDSANKTPNRLNPAGRPARLQRTWRKVTEQMAIYFTASLDREVKLLRLEWHNDKLFVVCQYVWSAMPWSARRFHCLLNKLYSDGGQEEIDNTIKTLPVFGNPPDGQED